MRELDKNDEVGMLAHRLVCDEGSLAYSDIRNRVVCPLFLLLDSKACTGPHHAHDMITPQDTSLSRKYRDSKDTVFAAQSGLCKTQRLNTLNPEPAASTLIPVPVFRPQASLPGELGDVGFKQAMQQKWLALEKTPPTPAAIATAAAATAAAAAAAKAAGTLVPAPVAPVSEPRVVRKVSGW